MLDVEDFKAKVQALLPNHHITVLTGGIVGWDSTRRWYHGVRIDEDFDHSPAFVARKIEASIKKRLVNAGCS